jgi:SEC-C motif-containing protein
MKTICPCGSQLAFTDCCETLLLEYRTAETAEELMRSRYSAYSTGKIDYLVSTTHPSQRQRFTKKEMEEWSKSTKWLKLEIVESLPSIVEFKAHYIQGIDPPAIHHERSTFVFEGGKWYYLEGIFRN